MFIDKGVYNSSCCNEIWEKGISYFKEEGNKLKKISFTEFTSLSPEKQKGVLKKIEWLITQTTRFDEKTLYKLKEIRNTIFCTLSKPAGAEVCNDILRLIFTYTSPKDVANIRRVCKKWLGLAGNREIIHSINRGISLKEAVPLKVHNFKDAVKWLHRNVLTESALLTYGNLIHYDGETDNDLKLFIKICPNLTHLSFDRLEVLKLGTLPKNLQVLDIALLEQNELPDLPHSLRELSFRQCKFQSLPSLPPKLQKLSLDNCVRLRTLPELSPVLRKLYLENIPLTKLPELPSSLLKLKLNDCDQLTELPALPSSLRLLSCWTCNELTTIHRFPESLEKFAFRGRNLKNLPELPSSLQSVQIDGWIGLGIQSQLNLKRYRISKMSLLERTTDSISETSFKVVMCIQSLFNFDKLPSNESVRDKTCKIFMQCFYGLKRFIIFHHNPL